MALKVYKHINNCKGNNNISLHVSLCDAKNNLSEKKKTKSDLVSISH